MTARLLLLWVGFAFSREADIQKRVVGGRQCQPNERLYHVRLSGLDPDGTWSFCGGSLLTDRWILTASHCWQPGRTMFAVVGVHPGPGQRVEIISEPRIYRDNNDNVHDIMLLKLPYPTNIPRVAYPDCDYSLQPGATVEIAGHGETTAGPNNERTNGESPTLQCANIDVVDCSEERKDMKKNDKKFYKRVKNDYWFCGNTSQVDVCPGDSGGVVVFDEKIYGVISFLGDPKNVCQKAAAFMDLCNPEYAAWIRRTIT
ncbi:hypothetical protein Q5P01_000400 [Channa striata]|uniref:Peptidase S1 domain-containing protein n=1 Tax=Channa striata TaxID=64152 RepID=A0AA88LMQ0_CHASR|nr:hypothetical protein Q5P01_000400 [Channa striata]